MKRRALLKILSAGTLAVMGGRLGLRSPAPTQVVYEDFEVAPVLPTSVPVDYMKTQAPSRQAFIDAFRVDANLDPIQANFEAYLAKMASFDRDHPEDLYVSAERYPLLLSVLQRMERVQQFVGYGNFNVLGFDEMRRHAGNQPVIGAFPREELDFLESIFFSNAQRYGFFGEKVTQRLTEVIPQKDRIKVPYTGHYVFRGDSLAQYERIRRDLGESITLTSGIRSVVKQTHLFLARTLQCAGNLSRASRSLAPPGHSFHGIGDFDVGRVDFGQKNFTTAFARTKEFHKLVELGYVNIRYPEGNLLGVRYEPWHIKVV